MINQVFKKMMEQYDLTVAWKNSSKSSMVLRNGPLTIGYLFWEKKYRSKGFNIASTLTLPNTSCISEQFKDSGGTFVDPELQDNVLLLEDFAEYFYHIGNISVIHSIIRGGLIPKGRSLKRETICVFSLQ